MTEPAATPAQRPEWLKIRFHDGPNYRELKDLMRGLDLHTVCEEARCPNIHECWEQRTATFMILGDTCTRACAYCAVKTGRPLTVDWLEPQRVARAAERMGLKHAVITSVNRDDLPDGGATLFAATIRKIRERIPDCSVEVLIPDFDGSLDALKIVLDAEPDILNHNIETVPRIFKRVRARGSYRRSLDLLQRVRGLRPEMLTKSGIIVGMGETREELIATMQDLRSVDCDILTIGQYLRPTDQPRHLPVQRYYTPDEFAELKAIGEDMGFRHVEAGPLVRSSYHARQQVEELKRVKRLERGASPAS